MPACLVLRGSGEDVVQGTVHDVPDVLAGLVVDEVQLFLPLKFGTSVSTSL